LVCGVGVHNFGFAEAGFMAAMICGSIAGCFGFKLVDVDGAGLVFSFAVAFNLDVHHLPQLRVLLFIYISLSLVSYSPLPSDTARRSNSHPHSLLPLPHSESDLVRSSHGLPRQRIRSYNTNLSVWGVEQAHFGSVYKISGIKREGYNHRYQSRHASYVSRHSVTRLGGCMSLSTSTALAQLLCTHVLRLSIVLGDLAPPSTDGRTDGRTVT
jgi:hypothetical protein